MGTTFKIDNINALVNLQDDNDSTKKVTFDLSNITTSTTRTLTVPDNNITLVGQDNTQTLTNKTINADSNTITNIDNNDIKSGAAIDATKIADGTVNNTKFQYLNGLSSNSVGISDTQTLTNKTFTDVSTYLQDNLDNTKKLQFQLSGITTGTTRTLTIPDVSTTLVGNDNSQTLTNKVINADLNTISNIDNGEIKVAAMIDVTKIANGSVTNTEFQYLGTVTSNVQDQIDSKISYSETNLIDIKNGAPGSSQHVQFKVTNNDNMDTYNLGLDTNIPVKIVTSTEYGTNRQAVVIAGNEVSTSTIFGISRSDDSGSTWNPVLVARQDQRIGIGKNNPTEALDVVGNIAVSGTIDGRNVSSDGATQDSHIAANSNVHGISGTIVGTTDTQTLTNKTFTDNTLYIQDNSDNTKKFQFDLSNITTSTTRTLTVPDNNTVLVGDDVTQTLTNKTVTDDSFTIQDNVDNSKKTKFQLSNITTGITRTLTVPDSDITLIGKDNTVILTNKIIDADSNTITNIDNIDIKSGAAIDATKIHNGTVSNNEFGYLNGVTSSIQTQIDGKATTSHTHDWDAATGTLDILPFNIGVGDPSYTEGKIFYDAGEHTIAVFNDQSAVIHQLGQEGYIRVYNNSGATITDGKPVYISGAEGTEDRPTIALAKADTRTTSHVIGITTMSISNNSFGYVTYWGLVNDLDTSSYSSGDTLYLSEITAGEYRATSPPVGNYEIQIGFVIKSHVTAGRVLVALNQDLASVAGDANELVIDVIKSTVGTINIGQLVYLVGYDNGNDAPQVELADSSSSATMPAFAIMRESCTNSTIGKAVVMGQLLNQDTSSFNVGDALYVSETAGVLTVTKPIGNTLIQKVGIVLKSHASSGIIEIFGAGRSNALPNLSTNKFWIGNGSSTPVEYSIDDLTVDGSPDGASDYVMIWDNSTNSHKKVLLNNLPDIGEINTVSNIGTSGIGIFKQKNGVDLELKKINSGSNKVTITDDTGNDEIDIDIDETNISINSLSGAPSGSVIGNTDTQTLTNKTVTDDTFYIQDNLDNSKKLQFQLSGITTSNTRILTVPDVNDTVVGLTATQTLTNKTLTTPIISSISNTGTLTLPTSTDTLVGRNTTDTLINKTFTDNVTYFQDNSDNTKKMQLDISNITTSTTRTFTLPDADTTLVGIDTTQTLTNKTITSPLLNIDNIRIDGNTISSTDTNGDISIIPNGSGEVILKADPSSNFGAATKQYVDSVASGLEFKDAVRAKTDSALSTYTQSGTGVGATLTATANGALSTQDGITLNVNDRLLVDSIGSTNDSHNGIYTLTQVGDGSNPWILTRATDADQDAEVNSGMFIFIEEGTNYAGHGMVLSTNNPITIDTTGLEFVHYTNIGEITAGDGISKSGTTILIDLKTNGGLVIEAAKIGIDLSATSITGNLVVSDGGTGTTTFTSGNFLQGNGTSAITATKTVPTGDVVGTNDTQTLTNKTLTDSTTYLVDNGDNTKKIQFQLSNITTGNTRILTVPDDNLTLIGTSTTQTLTNKTFTDDTFYIQDNLDNSKKLQFQLSDITTSNTRILTIPDANTTLVGTDITQTLTNKTLTTPIISSISNTGTITLPTSTDTLVGRNTIDILTNKTFTDNTLYIQDNGDNSKKMQLDLSNITTSTTRILSIPDVNGTITILDAIQTLTNKIIDADNNTLTNIDNNDIKSDAAINATKIADGSISNTEFQYLNGITSNVVSVNNTQTLTNKTLTDNTFYIQDNLDNSKKLQLQLNNLTTSTTRTLTVPDANTTIVGTDTTQTLTNKTLTNPNFSTIINTGTLSLPSSTDTLIGRITTDILSNKTFNDNTTYFQDSGDSSKKLQFQLSGITTSTTRILTIPDTDDTITTIAATQTLTNKTINADNNNISNIDNANIKSGAAIDVSKIADGSISNTEFQYLNGITSNVVSVDDTQILTNKTLTDNTFYIQDNLDNSKKLQFQLSDITTSTTRTLTIPNFSTTLVGDDSTQILTNKTLDSITNTITADNLHSATTTIDISSATAPTSGQVLTATSSTAAVWQTPSGGGSANVDAQHAVSSTLTSTTTATYIDLNSMTITSSNSTSTTYLLTFSCEIENDSANQEVYIILNVDGSDLTATERSIEIKNTNKKHIIATNCLAENLANSKIIKVRYKTTGGTCKVYNRVLTIYGIY